MVQSLKFSALPAHKNSHLAGCCQSVFDGSLPSTLDSGIVWGLFPYTFHITKIIRINHIRLDHMIWQAIPSHHVLRWHNQGIVQATQQLLQENCEKLHYSVTKSWQYFPKYAIVIWKSYTVVT